MSVGFRAGWLGRRAASVGAISDPLGALVYLTADDTGSPVPWDAKSYGDGWWNAADPTKLTVPSGVSVVRFQGAGSTVPVGSVYDIRLEQRKNGASFRGQGINEAETAADDACTVASALQEVSAGDYFTLLQTTAGGVKAAPETWAAIEKIDPSLKRALVYRTSGQSISAGGNVTLSWQAAQYDVGSWWSAGSPTKLICPFTGLIRVTAGLVGGNVTGQFGILLLKNGANVTGQLFVDTDTDGSDNVNGVSAILAVTAGDELELQAFATTATTTAVADNCFFAIEELDAATSYCLLTLSADQAISAGVTTTINWTSELADTDGAHSTVTNSSRITVPAGKTRARVSFNVNGSSAVGQLVITTQYDGGTPPYGAPRYECDTAGQDFANGFGAWMPVTAGHYLELQAFSTSARSLTAGPATWICVEFR